MADETSLLLLKPDAIAKNLAGEVLQRLLAEGFRNRAIKMLQLTDELLKEHYSHIADRPFFPEVADFMKSKPVIALAALTLYDERIFELDDPISKHCPEWTSPTVKDGDKIVAAKFAITPRMLMSHSSTMTVRGSPRGPTKCTYSTVSTVLTVAAWKRATRSRAPVYRHSPWNIPK
jgi:hypothetical protein